ncbi:MAG TPA: transposase [Candidatus Baltobacteraceae bacterium]|nr:transposase [Candidatus Baltobacteraceae bacterium]
MQAPHFTDEEAARKYLEVIRWPNGSVCPKCGSVEKPYTTEKPGVYRCSDKDCRSDFTVRARTARVDLRAVFNLRKTVRVG